MRTLTALIRVEARLLRRDLPVVLGSTCLPTVLLIVLGCIPALREHSQTFDGHRFIDVFCPSLVVLTVAVLGLNHLPTRLTNDRETGVLRRMSTTPASPAALLLAQLIVGLCTVVLSVALMIAVAVLVFGVPTPRNPLQFTAAFGIGTAAVYALGLLIAALAPTARAGAGIAIAGYVLVMFLGGVYLPRFLLPSALRTIGDYAPPGVGAMEQSWIGGGTDLVHLGVMAAIALTAGTVAAKTFRWV